jgi:hypothetical protein
MPSTGSGSVKALRYRIAAPRGAGVEGDSAHSMTASVLRWVSRVRFFTLVWQAE